MKRRWLRNSLLLFLLLAAGIFLGEKAQSISDIYRVLPGTGLENTVTVKNYLIRGARRENLVIPDRSFGWGILDIYSAFESLQTY